MIKGLAILTLAILVCGTYTPEIQATDDGRHVIFYTVISPDGTEVAFSHGGDIWVAEIETGQCRRVTDHVAYDWAPVWFPDGTKIAYTSYRDGNEDVYTVPSNGGTPTRHTWYGTYDVPLDITPDGEDILFRSYRDMYASNLFLVDTEGGLERRVTSDSDVNREACYSSDGSKIVVARGSQGWTRRDYRGSSDTDLYVMDADGTDMRWVESSHDGLDYWPRFSPDDEYIYFVSDRSGNENVFRIPAEGGDADQITFMDDYPVLFLSMADTGRIAFTCNFRLYVLDPGEEPRMVDIDLASEPKHSQDIRTDMSGQIDELELSPTGEFVAYVARGEIYVSPVRRPGTSAPMGDQRFWESVRVTENASHEEHVAWHPDGDRLVLISDRDGNKDVFEINLRDFEWTQITETDEEEYLPNYSPDGKWLAYYRGNDKLILRDTETGEETTRLHQLLQTSPWANTYLWSPDSNWIAFNGNDGKYNDGIYVFTVDEDGAAPDPVNISLHHDGEYLRGWGQDGSVIYFASSRDIVAGLNPWGAWGFGYSMFAIELQNDPPPLSDYLEFPPLEEEETDEGVEEDTEDAEETADEEAADSDEEAEEEEWVIEIDFDRIEERVRRLNPTNGGGYACAISPDMETVLYESNALGSMGLWSVPFEGGSANHVANVYAGISELEWLPDSSGAYYLSNRRVYFFNGGSVSGVTAYGRLTVNLYDERFQMADETGRILENHFYDADMHGYDWDSIVEDYTPLIAEAAVPEEFSLLMRMMFGELSASHLSCYASSSNEGIGYSSSYLGIDFDDSTEGPGLMVTKVYDRGPADYDETRIEVGEWVLEIDGTPVSTDMNFWALMDDRVARSTTLLVAADQDGTDSREVTLAPITWYSADTSVSQFWQVQYMDWVEGKREIVDDISGGEIGYVHIPSMSGPELEEFARELFAENMEKDAIIIDVRYNGGGNTHEQLLDILNRPLFSWSRTRGGEYVEQPSLRWDKPTVVLINQRCFSDSEIFPYGVKALGLGTLIGTPTSGGVIGTWTITMVDGYTRIRVPRNGWWTDDFENMERMGVEPDIYIEQDLNHLRDGIDDQLNYAVEYLMDLL